MAAISQTTLSIAFSWIKMLEFRLNFHWSLFLRVQLTIFQHWFRQWLGAIQATSHYLNQWWLVYWRIYASLGLNELNSGLSVDIFCWGSGGPYHLNFQGPQAKFEGSLHWNTLPFLQFWGGPLGPQAKFHKGPIRFSGARGPCLRGPVSPVKTMLFNDNVWILTNI